MKRLLSVILSILMLTCLFTAAHADDLAGTKLEIAFDLAGKQLEVFESLVAEFEERTGIEVTVVTYGDDYESTMKNRMGTNNLPDIWTTHGWSIMRYSEYLMPLTDQPWVSKMTELATDVITNDEGDLFVLMINAQINATLTNMTVCEAAGVDPYAIHTWDDFTAACAKIKEAGYTPIGNPIAAGNLANIAGSWIIYEGEILDCKESLRNETFDWQNFMPELKVWQDWYEKGYVYEDMATISTTDIQERWANDKAAFYLGVNTNFPINTKILNPDGNYVYIPTPASTPEGQMSAAVGEGNAFGIWKDTKNEAGAKAFLEFMAETEPALTLTAQTGFISCLENTVEASKDQYAQGLINDMQGKFENVAYENFFDREYMPSGMWPIFKTAVEMMTTDHTDEGLQDVIDYLSDNYTELWESYHQNN